MLVKGLPLAYNRDLQEDKPRLFDSVDTVERVPGAGRRGRRRGPNCNREAIAARLERGHLDATTLMEHLIRRGVPQRTAHSLVGTLVRKALNKGVSLSDLPLEEFRAAHGDLDATVYDVLGVANAVRAFVSYGSTAPAQVEQQVRNWRERVGWAVPTKSA